MQCDKYTGELHVKEMGLPVQHLGSQTRLDFTGLDSVNVLTGADSLRLELPKFDSQQEVENVPLHRHLHVWDCVQLISAARQPYQEQVS
jgi:hypothetical protein